MEHHTVFDWSRRQRTGVPEVVFAEGKTNAQLLDILDAHEQHAESLLFTRLTADQMESLSARDLRIEPQARTATYRLPDIAQNAPRVAVVAAGTSDLSVALESQVAARFFGLNVTLHADVGVAGLWRLERILPELVSAELIIAVAGMEGALFSVLAGLVPGAVIAVPTSVGYGVAEAGKTALASALASCAPGLVVVNIDNGFGAAAAARKLLRHLFVPKTQIRT
jgi:NCAIR mutase (PurE)-related protein